MKLVTRTERVGEWLGDVPGDWDYDAFFVRWLASCTSGNPSAKEHFDRSVELFKAMAEALKAGKTVHAMTSGGFWHEVYHCGLYDGWVFWVPRPCFVYKGPIPGEHRDEFYSIQQIRIP